MALKIYNTLSGKKELFKPLRGKKVNLFVCGPTVYDLSHLGHARTYIAFDLIANYLRFKKYKVEYVQNITDIDDKIIGRARELNIDPLKLSEIFAQEYHKDTAALNITSVSTYARASDFISRIIKQIQTLIKKGYAYEADDGVYFDVARFPDYGKLSRQKIKKLKPGARIQIRETKRHPFDFDLWKKQKPGEPSWPSPWGSGRPGWHIEDTAISEAFFGRQYDLHGGAQDLIFPHHESEIAQMEAASGKKPFVKYWLHTGFLKVAGEKMSKSLGNFITIREFLNSYPAETLRLVILSSHYRSPIDYRPSLAAQATRALSRITEFLDRLDAVAHQPLLRGRGKNFDLKRFAKKFFAHLDDDFNTPKALSILFDLITDANKLIDRDTLNQATAKEIKKFFGTVNGIFGILPEHETVRVPQELAALIERREQARKEKNWLLADQLRSDIERAGYKIKDTEKGPIIKKISND